MDKSFIINSNDVTNIIDIYKRNNQKYQIATNKDIDTFIHKKTEDYINSENKHVSKIMKSKNMMKATNLMYEGGLLIVFTLSLFYKISLLECILTFFSIVFIKCISIILVQCRKNYEEHKIKEEILKIIHNGVKMDVFNIHIPVKNANMEPYAKLVYFLERNDIHFPGLMIDNEYRPAEELDIRSKMDFLKMIIEYNEDNNGISILCVEDK